MAKGIFKSMQGKRLRRQVQAALEQGRWDEARTAAEKLVGVEPHEAEARVLLGLSKARSKDFAGALAAFEQAAKLDPDNALTWKNLVLAASRAGSAKWAMKGLEELVRLEPNDMAHVARLKDLCFRVGQLDKALQLCKAHGFNAADVNAIVRAANHANKSGKPKVALALASALTKLDAQNPKGYTLLGSTYFQSGDLAKAQQCYEKAISIDPGNAVAQNNLALVFLRQKQWDKASAILEKLAQNQAGDVASEQAANVLTNLAKSYEQQNQLKRAQLTYQRMLNIEGAAEAAKRQLDKFDMPLAARRTQEDLLAAKLERTDRHDDMTLCRECGAKVERGATFCQSCGAVYGPSKPCPSCSAPLAVDAKFCCNCGAELAGIERTCLLCSAANPEGASHCGACGAFLIDAGHVAEANAQEFQELKQCMALRRVEDALNHCRTMQQAEPQSPFPWLAAAMVYEAANRPQQALQACTQAAELAADGPASAAALERLAMLRLFHFNQPAEALQALDTAMRRHPGSHHWLYLIGLAHARLGQVDEAIRAFRQLSEDPRYELLAQATAGETFAAHGSAERAMGYCSRVLHPTTEDG